MSQERTVYINGDMVPEREAKISVRDTGFLYGDAVFDTTRTFDRKIFRLTEHLDRFYNSLRYMRLDPGMSKDMMERVTLQVLDKNLPLLEENDDYWVTQRVTRGESRDVGQKPTVIVECIPLPFAARAASSRGCLPVVTPAVRRTPPQSMSPRAKAHNYMNVLLGDMEVKGQNPEAWAILLDINGNITEGMGRL